MNWQIIVGVILLIGGIGNIKEEFGIFLFCTLIGALLIYFGLKKKGIIKSKHTKADAASSRVLKEEIFHAVGVHYYEENIMKLAVSNSDWKLSCSKIVEEGKTDRKIYQHYYVNKPVKLQQEPENERDKNAIAIIIAGEKVGYISREENVHVRDILEKHEIKSLSGFIGGGKYKIVLENGNVTEFENLHTVNIKIRYV